MNLRHGARGARDLLSELDGPSILIADELTASLAAQLDWTRIQGFAVDAGSRTYHTAILARSLKVPAIVGLHDASTRIAAGTPVIVDGTLGEVIVAPAAQAIEDAQRRALRPRRGHGPGGHAQDEEPLTTADGMPIRLQANVELLEDLQLLERARRRGRRALSLRVHAVGALPRRRDRRRAIRALSQPDRAGGAAAGDDPHLRPRRAAARPARWRAASARPGLRGLRLGLARPEILRTQLRALVRASVHGRLRVMFPFVTAVEEVREARRVLTEVAGELGMAPPLVGVDGRSAGRRARRRSHRAGSRTS